MVGFVLHALMPQCNIATCMCLVTRKQHAWTRCGSNLAMFDCNLWAACKRDWHGSKADKKQGCPKGLLVVAARPSADMHTSWLHNVIRRRVVSQ